MSALTNNNRVQHSRIINALMNLNGADEITGMMVSPLRSWKWGRLGKRLGSVRSADGIVFDLPDAVAPDGKKVVAKFIFTRSWKEMQAAKREYKLGQMMASAKIGARPYAMYEILQGENDLGNLVNYGQTLRNKGLKSNNLFAFNSDMSNFGNGFVIIMENLYQGPGILRAATVKDAQEAQLPIPVRQIKKAVDRMHKFGIVHGDMHFGNIMIQYIKKPYRLPTTRVVIIDFGRSILASHPLKTMKNANEFARRGRTQNTTNTSLWANSNGNYIRTNGNMLAYYNRLAPSRLPAFLRRK